MQDVVHSDKYVACLQSEWWHDLRARMIKRCGGKCERCNKASPQLQLHHLHYERIGNELEYDVEVVCSQCHEDADREMIFNTRHLKWCLEQDEKNGDDRPAVPSFMRFQGQPKFSSQYIAFMGKALSQSMKEQAKNGAGTPGMFMWQNALFALSYYDLCDGDRKFIRGRFMRDTICRGMLCFASLYWGCIWKESFDERNT